ncbi:ATP-binding protein [Mycobacterium sp. Dal123C01]|uniref:ATP-binding protein n=1 Tax=Mycobacterium sp. Dal123C01 TaxID=3457577 RepID=UPI00403E73DA
MKVPLICLTGAPGCGKTALSARLAAKLTAGGRKVAMLTVWDALLDPAAGAKLTMRRPEDYARHAETLEPTARTELAVCGLKLALDLVRHRGPDILIAPGYWYTAFAEGVAAGGDRAELRRVASELPIPDYTFHLRADDRSASALHELASELGWLERVGAAAAARVPDEATAMVTGSLTTDVEGTR